MQVKLVVLIWLIFFEGAALIYGVLHVAFLWLRRKAQIYFPGKMGEFFLVGFPRHNFIIICNKIIIISLYIKLNYYCITSI